MSAVMIDVRDLVQRIGTQDILRGFSIPVIKGETLVLLGRSGGGKSVFLRHLIGLMKPISGQIFVEGVEITHFTERQLEAVRRKIGMVFQDGALFDSMGVFENVAFPLRERGERDEAVIARAAAFYRSLDRRPVILQREMPGHVANRLASALYREAVHLVEQGVASVAEIDAALCNGPGLRWALMGPHMTYHLGGGEGGIAGYLAHLGPSQVRRWQSLGTPSLDEEVQQRIIVGVAEEAAGRSIAELEERRDEGLLALLRARKLVSE